MPRPARITFSQLKNNQMAGIRFQNESNPNETDEQVDKRLSERFAILAQLTDACIKGYARSLIVSGPAGLGKSYTVEQKLADWDISSENYTIVKGYVRSTGLIKTLYAYREKGKVIVFDDADTIFFDDTSLNLLKTVCDTTDVRRVSWLTEGSLVDETSAERIPKNFDFNGTIIFISNHDFDAMIERGHKLAPHLQAMISRSHYIDLAMKTKREYLVRIAQVVNQGLLNDLTDEEKSDVVNYVHAKSDELRELSLRMVLKIGSIRKTTQNWERVANVTCCRQ